MNLRMISLICFGVAVVGCRHVISLEKGDYLISGGNTIVGFLSDAHREDGLRKRLNAEDLRESGAFDSGNCILSGTEWVGGKRVVSEKRFNETREVQLGRVKAFCGDKAEQGGKLDAGASLQLYSCGEMSEWGKKISWGILVPLGTEYWVMPNFACEQNAEGDHNSGCVSFFIIKQIDIEIAIRLYDDYSVECRATVRDSRLISELETYVKCTRKAHTGANDR